MENSNEILPLEISVPSKIEYSDLNDLNSPKSISSLHILAYFIPLSFNIKYHGNLMITGFFDANNPNYPFIVIGPNYPYFIFALIIFMSYTFLFYFYMWKRANIYINVICLSFALLHHLIYFIVFVKNPGLIVSKPSDDDVDIPVCEYCGCITSIYQRQKHCEICNACFIEYDHHCPWTSKCIGGNNKVMFNCFLLLTLLQFVLPVFVILSYQK